MIDVNINTIRPIQLIASTLAKCKLLDVVRCDDGIDETYYVVLDHDEDTYETMCMDADTGRVFLTRSDHPIYKTGLRLKSLELGR